MKWERNPLDKRYPERLAGSTLASLIIHALIALLFFTLVSSSSQEGATENVSGGEIVTFERRSPAVVANAPAAAQVSPPVPHAPKIAPIQHAPIAQPQTQRLPQNRHELAVERPTAPPNPRPIPQQSPQPIPQPTQNVYEVNPQNALPAAPINVPTVAPLAVSLKAPPSAAPSPAPSAVPSVKPSPKPPSPTAAPSTRPATPAPAVPSASPTAAAVAVRASAAPSASPATVTRASAPPAPRAGVPSPSPTNAAVSKTAGPAPSPGPKGEGSPGPQPGAGQQGKPAPARPIAVRPTPSAAPATPKPQATANNINAKLRALLPNNPVNPQTKQYRGEYSLQGRMEPTPPPEVLAQTKYIYRSGGGSEGKVVMWVTNAHKSGPTTMCTGWLVRYPLAGTAPVPNDAQHSTDIPAANGSQISIGGRAGSGYMPPIVEGMLTMACDGRDLVPYAGSAAPSP